MFIEHVLVEGFKSYSLPTEMHFNPGIGVVVGNNGVGKSNIIDALVWALGEDDLERLRCYGTDDLFFSGSRDYPPYNTARVALTFSRGTEKTDSRIHMERRMSRAGIRTYFVEQTETSREEYINQLKILGFADSLKTVIRQEQLNDWLRLDPRKRLMETLPLFADALDPLDVSDLVRNWSIAFRGHFQTLLPEGDCLLYVENSNGEHGLEIEIRFPDKGVKKSKLISGGERTIASLAAKLALFDQLQSPIYLLDEVEPALDYTNHKNMQDLLKSISSRKQMIMITHLRTTIDVANTLHGVRTRQDGSSFMKFYFVMDKRLLRLYKCC
jgi:chromosome segregation protein